MSVVLILHPTNTVVGPFESMTKATEWGDTYLEKYKEKITSYSASFIMKPDILYYEPEKTDKTKCYSFSLETKTFSESN